VRPLLKGFCSGNLAIRAGAQPITAPAQSSPYSVVTGSDSAAFIGRLQPPVRRDLGVIAAQNRIFFPASSFSFLWSPVFVAFAISRRPDLWDHKSLFARRHIFPFRLCLGLRLQIPPSVSALESPSIRV
jgi:hypothetical protein